MASGVTGTSFTWDTTGVQPGSNYLAKVEASDGILTVEDTSDAPFTVEQRSLTKTDGEVFYIPGFEIREVLSVLLIVIGLEQLQRRLKRSNKK